MVIVRSAVIFIHIVLADSVKKYSSLFLCKVSKLLGLPDSVIEIDVLGSDWGLLP